MAYQRNTLRVLVSTNGHPFTVLSLLTQEDVLDEPLEREIGQPEICADDDARDQDDRDALDQLLLPRPLDLLQLGGGLGDEAPQAGARKAALDDRLGPPHPGHLRLPLNRSRVGAVSLPFLLGPARASLRSRLPGHAATRPGIGGLLGRCA